MSRILKEWFSRIGQGETNESDLHQKKLKHDGSAGVSGGSTNVGDGSEFSTSASPQDESSQADDGGSDTSDVAQGSREDSTETGQLAQTTSRPRKRGSSMISNNIGAPAPLSLSLDVDLLNSSMQKPLMEVALMFKALFKLIPGKYLQQIGEVLPELTKDDTSAGKGLPPFMFPRAMVSLLVAKATLPDHEEDLSERHSQLAGIVEHIYIAGKMHTGNKLTTVFKEDARMITKLAPSYGALLSVLLKSGVSVSRMQQLLKLAVSSSKSNSSQNGGDGGSERKQNLKLTLLGGDCLFAQGQWSLSNLDSAESTKVITRSFAQLVDCESRKRDSAPFTITEYLELERTGFPGVLSSGVECEALLNHTDPQIVQELTEYGKDFGMMISAWRDVQRVEESAKTDIPSIPQLFSQAGGGQSEEHILKFGIPATKALVLGLARQAVARLQCLKESPSKTLLEGFAGAVSKVCTDLCASMIPNGTEEMTWEELASLLPACMNEHMDDIVARCNTLREKTRANMAEARLKKVKLATLGPLVVEYPQVAAPEGATRLGIVDDMKRVNHLLIQGLGEQVAVPDGDIDMSTVLEAIQSDRQEVQKRLESIADGAHGDTIKRMAKDIFTTGGKRLRPSLILLCARVLQAHKNCASGAAAPIDANLPDEIYRLAVLIEVVHTASLVHDDILDDATTRRQAKAAHIVYGNDQAVLAGDYLFARAMELLVSLESPYATKLISLVLQDFAKGESMQGSKKFSVDTRIDEYLTKSFYKTASLLAAPCKASAMLMGFPHEECDVLYQFAFYLGLAFQVQDDILDFTSTEEELGKPILGDLRGGYITAPVIYALQNDPSNAQELTQLIEGRFENANDLQKAVSMIEKAGGIESAKSLGKKMADMALVQLAKLPASEYRDSLAAFAKWSYTRTM